MFTESEHKKARAASRKAGLNVAEWIRRTIFGTHSLPTFNPPTGWSVRGEFPDATLQRWESGVLSGAWPICQQEAISLGHALISKLPSGLSRNVDDLAKFVIVDNLLNFV